MIRTLLALALLAGCATGPSPAARPPNIVLIVSDDQAWTDYAFMGHEQIRTPRLDRLAAESLVYRRGYVPSSLCCPSLAALITGLYPHQNKVTCNDPPGDPKNQETFRAGRERMNRHMEAAPSLPRLLASRGYLSFQAGKWWQGSFARGGFTHGMTRGDRHGDDGLTIGRQSMKPIGDFIATARKEDKPYFVWYAPMLPHQPHNPPARLFDKYKDKTPSPHVARYWAMVEWFDETCGQLLDLLDPNTIVLYVTDNGWIQNPDAAKFAPKSKLSPYDGGLRTPIMVRWPGRVTPRRSDEPAMSIDLAPTILSAAGLEPAPGMQGVDLLDDAAVRRRPAIFGECFVHTAIDLDQPAANLLWRWTLEGRHKLIVPQDAAKKSELYDLVADPREERDLAAERPETVAQLRRRLDAWWTP